MISVTRDQVTQISNTGKLQCTLGQIQPKLVNRSFKYDMKLVLERLGMVRGFVK